MKILDLEMLAEELPPNFTGMANWYLHGMFYDCEYYKDGILHREDGPAVSYKDKAYTVKYCLGGKAYTKEEWFKELNKEQKIKALYNEENW